MNPETAVTMHLWSFQLNIFAMKMQLSCRKIAPAVAACADISQLLLSSIEVFQIICGIQQALEHDSNLPVRHTRLGVVLEFTAAHNTSNLLLDSRIE